VKGEDSVFAFPRLIIRNKPLRELLTQLKEAPRR
jgi:hypothetical protein